MQHNNGNYSRDRKTDEMPAFNMKPSRERRTGDLDSIQGVDGLEHRIQCESLMILSDI